MSPDDKAPPRGALEEAVSLYDELRAFLRVDAIIPGFSLDDLDRRRAALAPHLHEEGCPIRRFPSHAGGCSCKRLR